MRAAVLHLRDPRILVMRVLPLIVGPFLGAILVHLRQVFTRRRLDARGLRHLLEKLLARLALALSWTATSVGRCGRQPGERSSIVRDARCASA